jgi:hypothetical protein
MDNKKFEVKLKNKINFIHFNYNLKMSFFGPRLETIVLENPHISEYDAFWRAPETQLSNVNNSLTNSTMLNTVSDERKKHSDYFLSFIRPYEDRIKSLEEQVAYLRQSIVQLSKVPTVNPPPFAPASPVLNEISEDPI